MIPSSAESQDSVKSGSETTPIEQDTENQVERIQKAHSLLRTDLPEAARMAQQILDESESMPARAEAMTRWIAGAALVRMSRHSDAISHLEQGVRVARELDDVSYLRRLLRYVAAARYELGEFKSGRDAATEALQLTSQIAGARKDFFHAILLNELGGCETRLGNLAAAADAFTEAFEIASVERNRGLEAMLLINLVDVYCQLKRFDQAEKICREAMDRAIEQSVPQLIANSKLNLGIVLSKTGKAEEARQCFNEVLQLPIERGVVPCAIAARGNLAEMDEAEGNLEDAKEHSAKALSLARSINDETSIVELQFRLERLNGGVDEAKDLQRTLALREVANESGDMVAWIDHTETAILTHTESGDFEQALILLQELRLQDQTRWDVITANAVAQLENQVGILRDAKDTANVQHQQELLQLQQMESEARFRWMVLLMFGLGIGLIVTGGMLIQLRRGLRRERAAIATIRQQQQQQASLEVRMLNEEKVSSLKLLAGGIVHDFNNLLAVMTTSADYGQVTLKEEERSESFERIAEAAEQASQLTSQLVQYLGGRPSHDRSAALGPVAKQMKPLLTSVVQERATLKIIDETMGESVGVDESEARQILVNLVSNAVESMGERGVVSIDVRCVSLSSSEIEQLSKSARGSHSIEQPEPGNYCKLSVSDNGTGMSEATLKRVFDPYFSTKKTGHGLGMASVHGIVKGKKGAIFVHSELNVGTTVAVFLPALTEGRESKHPENLLVSDSGSSSQSESKSGEVLSPSFTSVLVVDDDPLVRGMMQRILKREGYTVHIAKDSVDARERLASASRPYSCVVVDYSMPGEDGLSFLKWIRGQHPEIRTVLCSGYHEQAGRNQSCVDLYIQKPFRSALLLAAVRPTDSLVET